MRVVGTRDGGETGRVTTTVRPAAPEDVNAVADVHVRSWQWAYAGLLPADLLAGLRAEDRVPQWQRRIESDDRGRVLLLADLDGAVVGFVAVGAGREQVGGPSVGELMAIYLVPEVAGTGTGRALHDAGLAWLTARGFTLARLWVLSSNSRARGFYERMGWRSDGQTRVETIGVEVEEARYERDLSREDGADPARETAGPGT
jgi:GNAT superfamily N-acetyltransferase